MCVHVRSVTCTDAVSGVIAVEENENLLLVSNGVGLYIMEREGGCQQTGQLNITLCAEHRDISVASRFHL